MLVREKLITKNITENFFNCILLQKGIISINLKRKWVVRKLTYFQEKKNQEAKTNIS